MTGTLVTAALIGALVGVVVGALGAGGGILSVPVLVYVLGQGPHEAAAGSLVIVLVTALVALPGRSRRRQVRWREGLVFGLLSSVGAWAGSWLNELVDGRVLMLLFAVLLACVAVVMARGALRCRRQEDLAARAGTVGTLSPGGPAKATGTARTNGVGDTAGPGDLAEARPRPLAVVAAATGTGLLTGFFGVGGGFVVVPVLMIVLRFDVRRAAGTSLLVMVIAALASLGQRLTGDVSIGWTVVLVFTGGSALGGLVGGPLSQRARPSTLRAVFAALLACVAVATLSQTLLT